MSATATAATEARPALQRVSPSRVTRIQARISDDNPHPSLPSRLVSSTVLHIYGVTS